MNRMIAWASLGVAIAGASYGRISMPKSVLTPFSNGEFGPKIPVAGMSAAASKNAAVSTLALKVEGMHCGGCANKVRNAIESIDGVKNAVVDHETGAVTIQWLQGGKMNKEAIKSAVAKVGYIVGGGM
jgi:copper chaperone CopZ